MNSRISLKTAWLAVIDDCNNRCRWCFERCTIRNNTSMSRPCFGNILNIAQEIKVHRIPLFGGEPFMHPDIFFMIKAIKEAHITPSIVTNGRLLSQPKTFEAFINSGCEFLTISLHGWNNKTYTQFTGSIDGFQEVSVAISKLQQIKYNFAVNIVIGQHTIGCESEIVSTLRQLGITQANFNAASPSLSLNRIATSFTVSLSEYKKQLWNLFQFCLAAGIKFTTYLSIPHCIFSVEELRQLLKAQAITSGCHFLSGSGVTFKPDGAVALCNHLMDYSVFNASDLNASNFLDKWNEFDLKKIRTTATCFPHQECIDCAHWSYCGGGCFLRWKFIQPFEKEIIKHFREPLFI